MTLSNPQPVGIFLCQTQPPPPPTGSNPARHCSTPRAGQAESPHSCRAQMFIFTCQERGQPWLTKGWDGQVNCLGSKEIFLLFEHSSCHPFACTAGVMRKKIYITVFMEQNTERAKQSNPSYQPVSSAMRNIQSFSQPRQLHLHFWLTLNFVLALIEPDPNRIRHIKQ